MLYETTINNGVCYLSPKKDDFSSVYLEVRKQEGRVYSDTLVRKLPYVEKTHRYYWEWQLRQKSAKRLIKYLGAKKTSLRILDLGCGNGWFSHQLSVVPNSEVFGLDINETELEQAARVFKKPNLKFFYGDVFFAQASDFLKGFDIITANSCIQYFPNLTKIIEVLTPMLNSYGELHILDSPFYGNSEIEKAKERTKTYYEKLGFPEMSNNYFHHNIHSLRCFTIEYEPKKTIMDRILGRRDSPFMWLKMVI